MSKRKRKQKTGQKTFCTEPIQDLKSAAPGEKPFKDLLFRPTIFKGRPNSTVDFDHITVPFAVRDNRVFMISVRRILKNPVKHTGMPYPL